MPAGLPTWQDLFYNMRRYGVWAEGPVVQLTAWLLQRDISIVSPGSTARKASFKIMGGGEHGRFPPLILWNKANTHYQSLLPTGPLSPVATHDDDIDFVVVEEKTGTAEDVAADARKATCSPSPNVETNLLQEEEEVNGNSDLQQADKGAKGIAMLITPYAPCMSHLYLHI